MADGTGSWKYLEQVVIHGGDINQRWATHKPTSDYESTNFTELIDSILNRAHNELRVSRKPYDNNIDLELEACIKKINEAKKELEIKRFYKKVGDNVIFKVGDYPVISLEDIRVLTQLADCEIKDYGEAIYVPSLITDGLPQEYEVYIRNSVGDYELMK